MAMLFVSGRESHVSLASKNPLIFKYFELIIMKYFGVKERLLYILSLFDQSWVKVVFLIISLISETVRFLS